MGQPDLTVLQFGNRPMPGSGVTMSWYNLADGTTWRTKPPTVTDAISLKHMAGLFRGKSARVGGDFLPKFYKVNGVFDESGGYKIADAKATLTQAGEQYLTTDNVTQILAELVRFERTPITNVSPYKFNFELEFICREPWAADMAATAPTATNIVNAPTAAPVGAASAGGSLATGTYTLQYTYVTASGETAGSPASSNIVLTTGNQQISVSAVTLPSWATAAKWYIASGPTTGYTVQNNGAAFTLNTAGSGGSAPASTPPTSFSITYAGSVLTRPVWALTIPSSNGATISGFSLQNTLTGQALQLTIPTPLAASTAWTLTVDTDAMTVTDQAGTQYDFTGSFPKLYPPTSEVNTFLATLTAGTGTPSGITLGVSYFNKWEL